MAHGRGSGETPPRVTALLKREVEKTSQAAVSRATGLPIGSINRYLNGRGEPTRETLEKLATYFCVSPGWLLNSSVISDPKNSEEESETYLYELTFNFLKKHIVEIEKDIDRHIKNPKSVYKIMRMKQVFENLRQARGIFKHDEFYNLSNSLENVLEKLKKEYGTEQKPLDNFELVLAAEAVFGLGSILLIDDFP